MKKWTSSLRLVGTYLRLNLSAGMAYRGAFLIQVFGMVLNNSAFIIFWLILYERIGGDINGYAFKDVMFLWSLAACGFGLGQVFWGNGGSISRIIYSGELDVYLLQPKPVLVNLLASRMIVSGWGDILYGIILFFVSQRLDLYSISLFLLFTVFFCLVFTSMRVIYHSLTFFIGNAESFAGLATEMVISFMLYPGSIFKGASLWILHSIIPAALVGYLPARLMNEFSLPLFAGLIAADLFLIAAALFFFSRGLRRYESGNRIGTRV
jgi:ABC-2 type transport system permease protein